MKTNTLLLIMIVALACYGIGTQFGHSVTAAQDVTGRWEYLVLEYLDGQLVGFVGDTEQLGTLNTELNAIEDQSTGAGGAPVTLIKGMDYLGAAGWELVTERQTVTNGLTFLDYTFKRRLP